MLEECDGPESGGHKESDKTERLSMHTPVSAIGELMVLTRIGGGRTSDSVSIYESSKM